MWQRIWLVICINHKIISSTCYSIYCLKELKSCFWNLSAIDYECHMRNWLTHLNRCQRDRCQFIPIKKMTIRKNETTGVPQAKCPLHLWIFQKRWGFRRRKSCSIGYRLCRFWIDSLFLHSQRVSKNLSELVMI